MLMQYFKPSSNIDDEKAKDEIDAREDVSDAEDDINGKDDDIDNAPTDEENTNNSNSKPEFAV